MKYFFIILFFSNVVFAYDYGTPNQLHLGLSMNGYFNYLTVKDKNNNTRNAYIYGFGNGLDELVSIDQSLSFFYNPTFIFATGDLTDSNDKMNSLIFSVDIIMGIEADFMKSNYIRLGMKFGATYTFISKYYSFLDFGAEVTIGEKIKLNKDVYDFYISFYYSAFNYLFYEEVYKEINSHLRISVGGKWYFY